MPTTVTTPTTYYRTGKGSHRHASVACANARRSVFTGDPLKIPAADLPNWPPCEHCCDAAEIAAAPPVPADPNCRNFSVTDPRRLYSTCTDCGKEGKVNPRTGTIRAHKPVKATPPAECTAPPAPASTDPTRSEPPIRNYATAQNTGTDAGQCDATAVHTAPSGARAYVVLDGIGRSDAVRQWTITAARRLARAASRRGDAEAGLRHVYNRYAAERAAHGSHGLPKAAAVVVVITPGRDLTVAWCGDSRAYLLRHGIARRLTQDHNLRRVFPPTATREYGGNRNHITSALGSTSTDADVRRAYGHPAIETATVPLFGPSRLLLASDGAYEPHLDAGHDLYAELDEDNLTEIAAGFVNLSVETAIKASRALDPARTYADNATVLVADIHP